MEILSACFVQILNRSITVCYVIAAVAAVRFGMRRLPKKYSYCLWAIVGLRMTAPFFIPSAFSLFHLKPFAGIAHGAGRGMEYIPEEIGYALRPEVNMGIPSVNEGLNRLLPEGTPAGSVNPMQLLLLFGACIWLTGIVILLVCMLLSCLRLQRRVRFAVLRGTIHGRRGRQALVYQCERVSTPFVMGIRRPRIYLPSRLKEGDGEYILAHEAYHVRRRDTLVKTVAFLLAAVYWFCPFVWLAYILMIRDMEMSCDEYVLERLGSEIKQDYSRALLFFAAVKGQQHLGPLGFRESAAGMRIKNVLHYKKTAPWMRIASALLIVGLAAVCLTDRRGENIVRVSNAPKEAGALFASRYSYTFGSDMSAALVYGDIYEKGTYAGRIIIASVDLNEQNREGEGILQILHTAGEDGEVSDLGFAYTEGAVSRYVNVPIEEKGRGLAVSAPEPGKEGILVETETPAVIAAVYLGDGETGRTEMYPVSCLEETGGVSGEFLEKIAVNQVSVFIHMVISVKDSEMLEQEYAGSGG